MRHGEGMTTIQSHVFWLMPTSHMLSKRRCALESVSQRRMFAAVILLVTLGTAATSEGEGASVVTPDYAEPKVLFDFFFDEPAKIGPALF